MLMNTKQTADEKAYPLPRTLREFWGYYWRFDPKRWALFVAQDLFHFSRYSIAFVIVGMTIDSLMQADMSQGIPTKTWMMACLIFLVLGFGESMHVWTAYIVRKWKPALRRKVRSDMFDYVMGHSHTYFQDHFAGSIARKVTEIAESSWRIHDHVRFTIFGSLVSMTTAVIGMSTVSPIYAAGLVLFILSVTIPVFIRLKKISSRARDFSEVRADVTGVVVDIFTNMSAMRNFSRQHYETSVHRDISAREEKSDSKRMLTLFQMENYRRLSLVLLGGGMMLALLWGWQHDMVTIGQMTTVMGQTFFMVGATWMFGWGVIMLADELGYIDDSLRTLMVDIDVKDDDDAKALDVSKGQIEFDDVRFQYTGQPMFEGLSLTVEPGEKIGLIGPSGAGKSTLVSLLLRLFDVQGGQICVDGQNVSDVTQESLRRQVALIPQDTSLFHRSLYDNIQYGDLDAGRDQVIEAAKRANADEFISTLEQDYETIVGERGIKLSGGQRQRIAIARAILKDAPVLVLDEATSSLDSESEKLIQESLQDLMEGKTVIAIAHRLSTIAHLDRLIVMDHGKIIEQGSHDELLKAKGLYARLWEMQSGGFLGDPSK